MGGGTWIPNQRWERGLAEGRKRKGDTVRINDIHSTFSMCLQSMQILVFEPTPPTTLTKPFRVFTATIYFNKTYVWEKILIITGEVRSRGTRGHASAHQPRTYPLSNLIRSAKFGSDGRLTTESYNISLNQVNSLAYR